MKLGIMQPYFIPYLGYFQLMNAVDKYIVYDDVNYIKQGRINRNNILINGAAHAVNILLDQASPNKHINEISLLKPEFNMKKLIKSFELAYSKAPYYNDVIKVVEDILFCEETNLALFLYNSFKVICNYLGIETELILSSSLNKDCSLKAERKVYHICEIMHADEYYNSIGGWELYDKEEFKKRGITLHFLKKNDGITYRQFGNDFVDNLSIIDVMMFNSKDEIQKLLQQYTLL